MRKPERGGIKRKRKKKGGGEELTDRGTEEERVEPERARQTDGASARRDTPW